jgi:hypothetical protein
VFVAMILYPDEAMENGRDGDVNGVFYVEIPTLYACSSRILHCTMYPQKNSMLEWKY